MPNIKARIGRLEKAVKANRKCAPKSETKRVAFKGIIRNVTTRIDAVGDKVGRIAIDFRPEGKTVAKLDLLQVPDKEVFIVIVEKAG